MLLMVQGRTAEAVVEMRRAVDLDPSFSVWHVQLGAFHALAGEDNAAIEELERAWQLAPGALFLRPLLAWVYHRSGRDEEALEAFVRDLPPELAGLERAARQGFAAAGFLGMVRAGHEWRVANSGDPCARNEGVQASGGLALLGEADAMFACLEKEIDRGDLLFLKANPIYDPYRAAPRFTALLRRMNLAE
jgi:tetratricopeptide (TPR) repeat protein